MVPHNISFRLRWHSYPAGRGVWQDILQNLLRLLVALTLLLVDLPHQVFRLHREDPRRVLAVPLIRFLRRSRFTHLLVHVIVPG